jgi:hypothetical protein
MNPAEDIDLSSFSEKDVNQMYLYQELWSNFSNEGPAIADDPTPAEFVADLKEIGHLDWAEDYHEKHSGLHNLVKDLATKVREEGKRKWGVDVAVLPRRS